MGIREGCFASREDRKAPQHQVRYDHARASQQRAYRCRLTSGEYHQRLAPEERLAFLDRTIDQGSGSIARSLHQAGARRAREERGSPARLAALRTPLDAVRPGEQRVDHQRRSRDDHAATMPAVGSEQIDRHGRANAHHAHVRAR